MCNVGQARSRQHFIGYFPGKRYVLWANIAQHWLDDIPMQCWKLLGQRCTGFLAIQYCLKGIKTTLNRIFLIQYCLELQGEPYIRFSVQCCPRRYSWENIAQIKTMCNVVREVSNNIVQEKILSSVVLKPMGQH